MYIPTDIHDTESRIEAIFSKLVKVQESCLMEIREDISGLTQKVESHATAIKHWRITLDKI